MVKARPRVVDLTNVPKSERKAVLAAAARREAEARRMRRIEAEIRKLQHVAAFSSRTRPTGVPGPGSVLSRLDINAPRGLDEWSLEEPFKAPHAARRARPIPRTPTLAHRTRITSVEPSSENAPGLDVGADPVGAGKLPAIPTPRETLAAAPPAPSPLVPSPPQIDQPTARSPRASPRHERVLTPSCYAQPGIADDVGQRSRVAPTTERPAMPVLRQQIPRSQRAAQLAEAATSFDEAQAALSSQADTSLRELEAKLANGEALTSRQERRLRRATYEIRSRRYAVQPLRVSKDPLALSPRYAALQQYVLVDLPILSPAPEGPDAIKPASGPWRAIPKPDPEPRNLIKEEVVVRPRKAWILDTSIWRPRRAWADARDFYDSDAFLRECFEADWAIATDGGALGRFVMRFNTSGSEEGVVMDEVKAAMLQHAEELFSYFDAYGMSGGGDYTHIQLNSFRDFLADCNLIEPGTEAPTCASRWDEQFVAINATASTGDQYNHKKGLNRQEFLSLLVRASVMRFMMPGPTAAAPTAGRVSPVAGKSDLVGHAAKAMEMLLHEQLFPRLRAELPEWQLTPANEFRRKFCYVESTSNIFASYQSSLRALYDHYAHGDGRLGDELASTKRLGFGEWQKMLDHLALVDGPESGFGERQATGAFVLARSRVVREAETKGRAKLLQLCFEDWLEALVRVALFKAFPSDETIAAEGCVDAGHYVLQLQADSLAWTNFLIRPRLVQSTDSLVKHLITLIFRTITTALGRPIDASNLEVTSSDVKAFDKQGGRYGAVAVRNED